MFVLYGSEHICTFLNMWAFSMKNIFQISETIKIEPLFDWWFQILSV